MPVRTCLCGRVSKDLTRLPGGPERSDEFREQVAREPDSHHHLRWSRCCDHREDPGIPKRHGRRCSLKLPADVLQRWSRRLSVDDAEPQARRARAVCQSLKSDAGATGVMEQAHAVSEQDGRDEDEDLVEHAAREALPRHIGAEHVDVLAASGRLSPDAPR